ncbi:hypothetical protein [Candidatus Pyrohabitans sp.]
MRNFIGAVKTQIAKAIFQKEIKELAAASTPAPTAGTLFPESAYGGVKVPNIPFSYEDLYEIVNASSDLEDTILTVKREVFRPGMDWQRRYVKRCIKCGAEYQSEVEECEECGSDDFEEPSIDERKRFEPFIEKANKFGQSLQEVLEMCEYDLEVADDAYLVVLKDYVLDPYGDIKGWIVREIRRGDPVKMRLLARDLYTCIYHRGNAYPNPGFCPICSSKLHRAVAVALEGNAPRTYYIEGEVLHWSKYNPSEYYGKSVIISLWKKAATLIYQEQYLHDTYKERRVPRGAIIIPTRNPESLFSWWKKVKEETRASNGQEVPVYAADPDARSPVSFVSFLQSLEELEFSPTRDEFRRAIWSMYMVTPIYMSDTRASGGLNNEGLQITITNRGMQFAHEKWQKPLRWLMKQFGIEGWVYTFNEVEGKDEERELKLKILEAQHAQLMKQLGYEPKLLPEGSFTFSEERKISPADEVHPPINLPVMEGSEQRFEGEPESVRKAYYLQPRKSILEEVFKLGVLWEEFKNLSEAESRIIHEVIIDSMLQPQGWSINSIIENIRKALPHLKIDRDRFETIVRTETTVVINKARELEYKARDPKGEFLYRWVGPSDERTTQICMEIKEKSADGLPLDELKKLVTETARKYGSTPREWTPHINCRHTFVRVVK